MHCDTYFQLNKEKNVPYNLNARVYCMLEQQARVRSHSDHLINLIGREYYKFCASFEPESGIGSGIVYSIVTLILSCRMDCCHLFERMQLAQKRAVHRAHHSHTHRSLDYSPTTNNIILKTDNDVRTSAF